MGLTKPAGAVAFVEKHGVVLASAQGPVPSLAAAIAGAPIKGSWWAHPKGQEIFRALEAAADSPDVLVCKLVGGKQTLVHRRVWPALVRLAARFPKKALAQVIQEHTASGKHVNREVAFPKWVPADVAKAARALSEEAAAALLGPVG